MKRREVFLLLGGVALTWPAAASAQRPGKVPSIGVLLPGTPASFALRVKAFEDGLRELGYLDQTTITIAWRWGQDSVQQLPSLAAELARLNLDVIVTGGTPAAKALQDATRTIPIIMAIVGDPVAAGLVSNLARPGGNVTGFSIVAPDLSGKRLQLLKELVPRASSIAVMSNNANPQSKIEFEEMRSAGQTLDLQLRNFALSAGATVEDTFNDMTKDTYQALIVLTDPILYSQRRRIVC